MQNRAVFFMRSRQVARTATNSVQKKGRGQYNLVTGVITGVVTTEMNLISECLRDSGSVFEFTVVRL